MTQQYVGTKIVTAWEQEQDGQPGYGVKYADGYTSWSPKDVFDDAYLPLGDIDFLPPYNQRMIAELAQLDDRGRRLGLFLGSKLFQALTSEDRELLREQASAMVRYASALRARIERFAPTTGDLQ